MSRALERLRKTTGDPLLVRAGRTLVLTPRALEIKNKINDVVHNAETILRPAETIDLKELKRIFTLRTSDGFVDNFGSNLIKRIETEAPHVRLHFVQKLNKESSHLRDGSVDLETGVVGTITSLEIRVRALFRDRFIGVVRDGHPLSQGQITPTRYSSGRHVFISRRGLDKGIIDEVLQKSGLQRDIITTVSNFSAALALTRTSDLIATVPERHTGNLRDGLFSFPIPLDIPPITVSMLWHPRMDADPPHRWLRQCILDICNESPF
jgi:DNA-binding transcriptional LysR family regulator